MLSNCALTDCFIGLFCTTNYNLLCMLMTVDIEDKIIGNKHLLHDLHFFVENGEKIGIIGRNGIGKTTLFQILSGEDTEFEGEIQRMRGVRLTATKQEHHDLGDQTALEYIVHNLPDYQRLKHIIDTYPDTMGSSVRKIAEYSDALTLFSERGYYDVEPQILMTLKKYQLPRAKALLPMARLSGGQKRFVELVRVQFSDPDAALIDEPTNHMDYAAKAAFIEWLRAAKHACLVITHDRDVLAYVDRIIEIKDKKAYSYNGNYDAYLKQNSVGTTNKLQAYEIAQRSIANIKKQIEYARAKKPSWGGTADKKNPFVVMEERLLRELKKLEEANPKPSFWIDQESVAQLNPKMTEAYDKYKEKNIKLARHTSTERTTELLHVQDAVLGYDGIALFQPVSFTIGHGERLHVVGRNGAGKTTLVRAITAAAAGQPIPTQIAGTITPGHHLRLNSYEQEVSGALLDLTLTEAVEAIYRDYNLPISQQHVMRELGNYLFDPANDAHTLVKNLSGGQKARLQLIRMLANKPNLLILDEPTNHLDLPSIEELENALKAYHGAILYISHDSYFARTMGGSTLTIQAP